MKLYTPVMRVLAAGMLMALTVAAVAQQAYPNKPMRFISAYSPGGSTTVVARIVGQKLTESWGQSVIVDNRPGGNTIIGTEALVKSPPDGYTILLATSSHLIIPQLLPAPYDPIRDFSAVATICSASHILLTNLSVPARNLQELIALLKAQPGKFNYASSGHGTTTHLASEFFKSMAGVDIQHIPYKGGSAALADLVGGQVQLDFEAPASAMSLIKSGRVRAIATSSKTRLSALPDLPTFAEAGLPDYETAVWYGVLAPAGTPKDVVNKLSTEIARIVSMPEVKSQIAGQGMDPFISSASEMAALMKADLAKYAKIIKTANIKID